MFWALVLGGEGVAGQETRIACVGDSITEGTANADHRVNSWPMILGRMLEAEFPGKYRAGNFGKSGATLAKNGRKPYWNEGVFRAGIEFAPSVVVINLGTNDAALKRWKVHGGEFSADLAELVLTYQRLKPAPRILLSNLTSIYPRYSNFNSVGDVRQEVEERIQRAAKRFGIPVIDLKSATAGVPEFFTDGLHPNTAGNELIAMAVFEAVTGEKARNDESIRPKGIEGEAVWLVKEGVGKAIDITSGGWEQKADFVEGTGARKVLVSRIELREGDFHLSARLRMQGQKNSAAGFMLNENSFGFEGARGTVFRNLPTMGGLRLLHNSSELWERDAWIDFEVIRNNKMVWFIVNGKTVDMVPVGGPIEQIAFDPTRSLMRIASLSLVGNTVKRTDAQMKRRTVNTPWTDLSQRQELRVVTDLIPEPPRPGDALGPDGKQLLRFLQPDDGKQNYRASISNNGGKKWSEPFVLPVSLSGKGHRRCYLSDGRLLVTFLDTHPDSPTFGDMVAWVGKYSDILHQQEGDFTCRLIDNQGSPFPFRQSGLVRQGGGGFLVQATSRLQAGATPALLSVRFKEEDLMELLPTRAHGLRLVDLDQDKNRHVVVDREKGQYLGHVTTELLDDGKTILAVYPKGHGRGAIVYKRSADGGRTWSDRLPTPANWSGSREVPTIHRLIDPKTGKKRLMIWSGLYPARTAISENDGVDWSELKPVGEWGGIVVMGFVERLKNGSYLAMFHDDGRFFKSKNAAKSPPEFTLYQTLSHDGGLTWQEPTVVWRGSSIHLCEPGCARSPDGTTLAVLLRENRRKRNSYIIFSKDEGETWTAPRELPASLTGDRHTTAYAPDGRLFICFRDTTLESPTQGDWVGWVGKWDDLLHGREGEYRIRFKDNKHRWDTTYPGVLVLEDGTFVVTTYGHWEKGEQPYILSVRFTLAELDTRK